MASAFEIRYKMLADRAYMEHHSQVAGIVYRNICAKCDLKSRGQNGIQPRGWWWLTNSITITIVVDKQRKEAVVITTSGRRNRTSSRSNKG